MRDRDRGGKMMLEVAIVSNKDIHVEIVNSTNSGTRLRELQR